jgi:hypothetical protein
MLGAEGDNVFYYDFNWNKLEPRSWAAASAAIEFV